MSTWLVTGASRGIGLELVRYLLADKANVVVATCRNPANATSLQEVVKSATGRAHIVPLDVNKDESIDAAAKAVTKIVDGQGLNYLLNNAGIMPPNIPTWPRGGGDYLAIATRPAFMDTISANVLGPALTVQKFVPLLEQAQDRRVVMNTSSGLGSLERVTSPGWAVYSISKAAVGMLTRQQAVEYGNITFVTMDPGWVQTDMGGPNAVITAPDCAKAIIETLKALPSEKNGAFINRHGEDVPF